MSESGFKQNARVLCWGRGSNFICYADSALIVASPRSQSFYAIV